MIPFWKMFQALLAIAKEQNPSRSCYSVRLGDTNSCRDKAVWSFTHWRHSWVSSWLKLSPLISASFMTSSSSSSPLTLTGCFLSTTTWLNVPQRLSSCPKYSVDSIMKNFAYVFLSSACVLSALGARGDPLLGPLYFATTSGYSSLE